MGETGVLLLRQWLQPHDATQRLLARRIEDNIDHPARELMWGAPGTLLAALFLHRRTGEGPWAGLFSRTARRLWEQLQWFEDAQCHAGPGTCTAAPPPTSMRCMVSPGPHRPLLQGATSCRPRSGVHGRTASPTPCCARRSGKATWPTGARSCPRRATARC
ncbi:hypothetical protein HK414_11220 [Ramlibacter terrae]|uniref:Uncharacterized protein n=1 Tax=Ramlibacter terrae TaxID=2732511 RepID=A0ABX6P2C0_9BURK|nr:hypothetical protein HK414_11220 [Ramlibacter terrae]